MIVQLFDRTQTIVTKAEANQIAKAINQEAKLIQINGMMINPKAIASIKPGGGTEADRLPTSHRLAAHDNRGEHSPALEAMRKKWGRADVPSSQQKTA